MNELGRRWLHSDIDEDDEDEYEDDQSSIDSYNGGNMLSTVYGPQFYSINV